MSSENRRSPATAQSPVRLRRGEGSALGTTSGVTQSSRLCPISAKIGHALSREIDAYAEVHGITRSHAVAEYLDIASEVLREREGIPGSRADEVLEVLERLGAAVELLGPPAFGILRLLAFWAAQGGGLKVNEDELLAEIRAAGADEWEQATAEAERMLQDVSRLGPEKTDG